MKVYTKTGDLGKTGLYKGERVEKTHPVIEALGSIDELTSSLGQIRATLKKGEMADQIKQVQQTLINVMGEIASTHTKLWQSAETDLKALEDAIDFYELKTGGFTKFILPGSNPLSAQVDSARTIARRAERAIQRCESITLDIKRYMNRLSDYLYSVARYIDKVFEETLNTQEETLNTQKEVVKMQLDLNLANQIIERTKEYAIYKGISVVIAVVTKEGNPISVQVMDESFVISYELALKKAFTAAALKMPTHELAKLTASGADFEGLENMLDAKIVTLGGGYPIKINGKVVGAIGVSGGNAADDSDIAEYSATFIQGE